MKELNETEILAILGLKKDNIDNFIEAYAFPEEDGVLPITIEVGCNRDVNPEHDYIGNECLSEHKHFIDIDFKIQTEEAIYYYFGVPVSEITKTN